jgi:hypothetical protein
MISTFALAAIAGGSFASAGCSDDNKDKHQGTRGSNHDGIADKSASYGRGLDSIPRDAERLTKDEGDQMHVRPNVDGRIYIYDERADRIVYEGPLRRHEELVADPVRRTLTIDEKRVNQDIEWNHKAHYRLYFLRD